VRIGRGALVGVLFGARTAAAVEPPALDAAPAPDPASVEATEPTPEAPPSDQPPPDDPTELAAETTPDEPAPPVEATAKAPTPPEPVPPAPPPDPEGRTLQTQKGVKFVGVPIPSYNPQFEFSLGLMGMVTYRLSEKDPYSPPSASMLFGLATTNGSWLAAGMQEVFWDRDNNRGMFAVAGGHFNSDYYGTGSAASAGISFPLGTDVFMMLPKYLRRVWKRLYVGGLYHLMFSGATVSAPDGAPEELDTYLPLTTSETASGLGASLEWDSRDNRFSPTKGFYVPLRTIGYAQFLGSSTDYGVFKLEANYYRALYRKDLILAVRGMLQTATSSTPFYLLPAVGSGPDLRGYASGRYRDYVFYATQAELRWYFWKGLGAVAFGGIGTTTAGFDQLFEGTVLPSYGLGLRYMIDKKSRLVVRVDYGRGDEDGMMYFSVSEAF
jgi:hypothetical protein